MEYKTLLKVADFKLNSLNHKTGCNQCYRYEQDGILYIIKNMSKHKFKTDYRLLTVPSNIGHFLYVYDDYAVLSDGPYYIRVNIFEGFKGVEKYYLDRDEHGYNLYKTSKESNKIFLEGPDGSIVRIFDDLDIKSIEYADNGYYYVIDKKGNHLYINERDGSINNVGSCYVATTNFYVKEITNPSGKIQYEVYSIDNNKVATLSKITDYGKTILGVDETGIDVLCCLVEENGKLNTRVIKGKLNEKGTIVVQNPDNLANTIKCNYYNIGDEYYVDTLNIYLKTQEKASFTLEIPDTTLRVRYYIKSGTADIVNTKDEVVLNVGVGVYFITNGLLYVIDNCSDYINVIGITPETNSVNLSIKHDNRVFFDDEHLVYIYLYNYRPPAPREYIVSSLDLKNFEEKVIGCNEYKRLFKNGKSIFSYIKRGELSYKDLEGRVILGPTHEIYDNCYEVVTFSASEKKYVKKLKNVLLSGIYGIRGSGKRKIENKKSKDSKISNDIESRIKIISSNIAKYENAELCNIFLNRIREFERNIHKSIESIIDDKLLEVNNKHSYGGLSVIESPERINAKIELYVECFEKLLVSCNEIFDLYKSLTLFKSAIINSNTIDINLAELKLFMPIIKTINTLDEEKKKDIIKLLDEDIEFSMREINKYIVDIVEDYIVSESEEKELKSNSLKLINNIYKKLNVNVIKNVTLTDSEKIEECQTKAEEEISSGRISLNNRYYEEIKNIEDFFTGWLDYFKKNNETELNKKMLSLIQGYYDNFKDELENISEERFEETLIKCYRLKIKIDKAIEEYEKIANYTNLLSR